MVYYYTENKITMKIFYLLIMSSFLFCNSTAKNQKKQNLMDENQKIISLKFKVEKMLGIG